MLHAYSCKKCKIKEEERFVKLSDMDEQKCDKCGKKMKRLPPLIAKTSIQWAKSAGTYYGPTKKINKKGRNNGK